MSSQLNFDSEGKIIVPRDISRLICKCGASYKISDLSECSVCATCWENLFNQLNEEEKADVREITRIEIEKAKLKEKMQEEFKKQFEEFKNTDEYKLYQKNKADAEKEFTDILMKITQSSNKNNTQLNSEEVNN